MRDPKSVFLGWKLGSLIAAQRTARVPVAWLYNGVRLPGIPDRGLPYATIGTHSGAKKRYLFLYSEPLMYAYGMLMAIYGKGYVYLYNEATGVWEEYDNWGFPDSDFETSECSITNLEWTNLDIRDYSSDALILAASEPVPVYE